MCLTSLAQNSGFRNTTALTSDRDSFGRSQREELAGEVGPMEGFQDARDIGFQANASFEVSWITSHSLDSDTHRLQGICENITPSYLEPSNPSSPSQDPNTVTPLEVQPSPIKDSIVNLADITNNVIIEGDGGNYRDIRTLSQGLGGGEVRMEECDFTMPEGTPSVGSNGGTDCSGQILESGSLLSGALNELLPRLIDDTGCTQDALSQLIEVESVANAVHRLGANKEQLLLHLLQSSGNFMMKNGKKRKGKGGRRPASDPRIDPNIDPKKARRIVANRKSAARSKEKQKKEAAGIKIQHDTYLCQHEAMVFEERILEECKLGLEKEKISLEARAEALYSQVRETDSIINTLTAEKEKLCMHQGSNSGSANTSTLNSSLDNSSMEIIQYHCPTNASVTASPIVDPVASNAGEEPPSKVVVVPAVPPQCPFDAPNAMLAFEDGGSCELMWDFGTQNQDLDMVDWKDW